MVFAGDCQATKREKPMRGLANKCLDFRWIQQSNPGAVSRCSDSCVRVPLVLWCLLCGEALDRDQGTPESRESTG